MIAAGGSALVLGGCGSQVAAPRPAAATAGRPNIVFVLTDDLSMNLLRFMPHVQAMQRHGLTFGNYFVSDSLCCPSRASIFSGNFPHDTGVYTNVGSNGGFDVFHLRGEERHTFAVALQRAGYRTA
ncbi:MAG TPA: sulfatase-like hydrolase/transferase, partial [Mycobacterium sp.]|nr:sulfatase-like hydrolase/transferase [Mycobacterium sp.]